jgi:hypothetical protein
MANLSEVIFIFKLTDLKISQIFILADGLCPWARELVTVAHKKTAPQNWGAFTFSLF